MNKWFRRDVSYARMFAYGAGMFMMGIGSVPAVLTSLVIWILLNYIIIQKEDAVIEEEE